MGLSFNAIKMRRIYYGLIIFTAALLIIDFSIPTTPSTDTVLNVKTTQQNYYNAGNNMHFSYSIVTEKGSFSVSESFTDLLQTGESIKIYRSIILNEVNALEITRNGFKEIYSLRWFTGMVIPLIVLILSIQKIVGIKRLNTVFLIAQIIFYLNVAFLITRAFYN
jgi:hypothetical protein